jgi:hypothetical protein
MALRASISLANLQASVATERLVASTTYSKSEATGIWVDPDSKNRMAKDEYALSEVHFTLLEKNVIEAIPLVDVSAYDFKALKEDSLSLAETFAKVVTYKREFTDAFTLDDLSQIDKDFYGNKGNIFAFTDIIGLTYDKVFTDSYTVSDIVSVVTTFKRNFTDSVSPGDVTALDISKISDDNFVFADTQAKGTSKTTTDNFAFSDAPSVGTHPYKTDDFSLSELYLTAITKHVTDAFVLDDATQVNKDYSGNKNNIVAFTDVLSRVLEYKRSFVDTLAITESTSATVTKVIADNFIIYDETIMNGSLGSNVLNSKQLNGKAKAYLGAKAVALQTALGSLEALTFTELSAMVYAKAVSDSVALTESNSISLDTLRSDQFNVGDASYKELGKGESDVFNVQELFSNTLNKDTSDAFNINDILGTSFNKTVADAFVLDDSTQVDKYYYGNKGNIFAIDDVVVVTKVTRKLMNGTSFNRTQLN